MDFVLKSILVYRNEFAIIHHSGIYRSLQLKLILDLRLILDRRRPFKQNDHKTYHPLLPYLVHDVAKVHLNTLGNELLVNASIVPETHL